MTIPTFSLGSTSRPPTGVSVAPLTSSSLRISFTNVENTIVRVYESGVLKATSAWGASSADVSGLDGHSTHTYTVRSVKNGIESADSSSASGTTKYPTISGPWGSWSFETDGADKAFAAGFNNTFTIDANYTFTLRGVSAGGAGGGNSGGNAAGGGGGGGQLQSGIAQALVVGTTYRVIAGVRGTCASTFTDGSAGGDTKIGVDGGTQYVNLAGGPGGQNGNSGGVGGGNGGAGGSNRFFPGADGTGSPQGGGGGGGADAAGATNGGNSSGANYNAGANFGSNPYHGGQGGDGASVSVTGGGGSYGGGGGGTGGTDAGGSASAGGAGIDGVAVISR